MTILICRYSFFNKFNFANALHQLQKINELGIINDVRCFMLINDNQYLSVIESIKSEISKAQYNAVLQVNKEMTMLYYHI